VKESGRRKIKKGKNNKVSRACTGPERAVVDSLIGYVGELGLWRCEGGGVCVQWWLKKNKRRLGTGE